jgi:hypothetical protein
MNAIQNLLALGILAGIATAGVRLYKHPGGPEGAWADVRACFSTAEKPEPKTGPPPTTAQLRDQTVRKAREVDAQIPVVRAHVQTLQARELAVKYAVHAAHEMIAEARWPITFAGARVETRGDAYRALIAAEDRQKKVRADLTRFSTALAALNRIREDLDDRVRTLDLVDAHAAVIDAAEFGRQIDAIRVPALPSEPATIDLPALDLTAIR